MAAPSPCEIVRRVQGRGELLALVRQGHREHKRTLLVLSSAACAPCARLAPHLHALLAATPRPEQTRVVWLDVAQAGSDDAYAFCLSRRMTGGVPALFAYTHSSDLHAPDAAVRGCDPAAAHALFVATDAP